MRRNSISSHKKAQKAQKTKPILCLLCLLCLFVATTRSQSPDVVQLFEQIATLIQNNRLPEAEKELNSILRVTPDLPVALNLLGTIRAKQNRLLEAETLFLRALRKDSKFTGARMNLVYLYMLKRAPDKAILQLNEVVALEPENFEARVMLGDAYLGKNDLQKAEENYLVALDGRLDNPAALLGLAQISRLKGDAKEPAIYLNRVATLLAGSKSPELLYKFAFEAMRVNM